MTAATARPQTAMKRLAGVLSFVCLVLFLLAIEQRHAVAIWTVMREEAVPTARYVIDAARRLPESVANGFEGLAAAGDRESAPLAAAPGAAAGLGGEYGPADEATRAAAGSMAVIGAELRLENGDVLRTRPLRIAAGSDAFAPGQTFAARLNARADAQIELREVVAPPGARTVPPARLCGGEPAGAAALLHRRDRVDLMLFRSRAVGPDTPAAALCGVWSFTAR